MSGSTFDRFEACQLPGVGCPSSACFVLLATVGLLLGDSTASASVFVDRPAVTNLEYAVDVGTWCGEAIEERGLVFGVTNVFLPKCKSPRAHLMDLKGWAVTALTNFVPNNLDFESYYGSVSSYFWTWSSWASVDGITVAALGECSQYRITNGFWVASEPRDPPFWSLQTVTLALALPHEQIVSTGYVIRTAEPKYPGWMLGQLTQQWGEGWLVYTGCAKGYFAWTPERSGAMYGAGASRTNAWQWLYYPHEGCNPIAAGYTDVDYGYARIKDVFMALTITVTNGCPYEWVVQTRMPDTNGVPDACGYAPGHYWRYSGSWCFDPYCVCWNGQVVINGTVDVTYSCTPWSPSSYYLSNVVCTTAMPHVYWYWDDRHSVAGTYSHWSEWEWGGGVTRTESYTWLAGDYWNSYLQKCSVAVHYQLPAAMTANCVSVALGFAEPYMEDYGWRTGGWYSSYPGCVPATNQASYFNISDGRLAARSVISHGVVAGRVDTTNVFDTYHSTNAFALQCPGTSCSGSTQDADSVESPPGYTYSWSRSESWTVTSQRREDRVPEENTYYYLFADWAFQFR